MRLMLETARHDALWGRFAAAQPLALSVSTERKLPALNRTGSMESRVYEPTPGVGGLVPRLSSPCSASHCSSNSADPHVADGLEETRRPRCGTDGTASRPSPRRSTSRRRRSGGSGRCGTTCTQRSRRTATSAASGWRGRSSTSFGWTTTIGSSSPPTGCGIACRTRQQSRRGRQIPLQRCEVWEAKWAQRDLNPRPLPCKGSALAN